MDCTINILPVLLRIMHNTPDEVENTILLVVVSPLVVTFDDVGLEVVTVLVVVAAVVVDGVGAA